MGWWSQNQEGHSFAVAQGADEMLWGDGPADAMGVAVAAIEAEFREQIGRKPTRAELIAGLMFSINVEYPADPAPDARDRIVEAAEAITSGPFDPAAYRELRDAVAVWKAAS